jgi:hypothetical protein
MAFDVAPNFHVRRDANETVRQLSNPNQPYRPDNMASKWSNRPVATTSLALRAPRWSNSPAHPGSTDQQTQEDSHGQGPCCALALKPCIRQMPLSIGASKVADHTRSER